MNSAFESRYSTHRVQQGRVSTLRFFLFPFASYAVERAAAGLAARLGVLVVVASGRLWVH